MSKSIGSGLGLVLLFACHFFAMLQALVQMVYVLPICDENITIDNHVEPR